jgi:hypothetical protein
MPQHGHTAYQQNGQARCLQDGLVAVRQPTKWTGMPQRGPEALRHAPPAGLRHGQ